MKSKPFIVFLSFAWLALAACGGSKEVLNPETGLGMYVGELPCADCPGIYTHLTMDIDGQAAITRLYYDSDNTSETCFGSWSRSGNTVTLRVGDETLYYLVQSDSTLVMAKDSLGTTTSIGRKHGILKLQTPMQASDFTGTYNYADRESSTPPQTLTISALDENAVKVSIVSPDAEAPCTFEGTGTIVNDQIEILLSTVSPDLKGTMVIRTAEENTLNVFTSRFKDHSELKFFCGGKGKYSLAGDYVRAQR